MEEPVRAVDGGVEIAVHAQPRASRSEVAGRHGHAVKVRLAAPPVDGAANEALVDLLSGLLGVPRGSVELLRGRSGRRKTVRVAGVTEGQVRTRLGL